MVPFTYKRGSIIKSHAIRNISPNIIIIRLGIIL